MFLSFSQSAFNKTNCKTINIKYKPIYKKPLAFKHYVGNAVLWCFVEKELQVCIFAFRMEGLGMIFQKISKYFLKD